MRRRAYSTCSLPCSESSRSASRPHRRHRHRPLLLAAAAAAALAIAGVAIAAGVGAFDGIGAADHAQTPQDVLDPESIKMIDQFNAALTSQQNAAGGSSTLDQIEIDTARLVGTLPTGKRLYVVSTTSGNLCVAVQEESIGCGHALSEQEPLTLETMDHDSPGGDPPVNFGVARDGITSLSFKADGSEVTVPVSDNVWAYEGDADLYTVSVHYADGSTATVVDGRLQS